MLVNDQGRACIAGFDLASIMEADGLSASDAPLADGTTQFQASELGDPDCDRSRSTASAVYMHLACYSYATTSVPSLYIPSRRVLIGVLDLHRIYPLPRCKARFHCVDEDPKRRTPATTFRLGSCLFGSWPYGQRMENHAGLLATQTREPTEHILAGGGISHSLREFMMMVHR